MLNLGVVGCGNISSVYFGNLTGMFKGKVNVYACADLVESKVKAAAEKYNIPHIMTFEEMLECDEIDVILNITEPVNHYWINKAAILAGKHVYCEKPLSIEFSLGKELVELAKEKGVYLGGAPDTFMGTGIQSSIRYIEDGLIGEPLTATAFMVGAGPDSWHPNPAFFFEKGAGPLLDMGPYYMTALINVFGEAESVCAFGMGIGRERTFTCKEQYGTKHINEVETHISGTIRFKSGALATVIMSFDIQACSPLPELEIFGTTGTLRIPDPNMFDGEVHCYTKASREWKNLPRTGKYNTNSRSVGLVQMINAIETGKPFAANCQQTLHVLEIMDALLRSCRENRVVEITTSYNKSELLDVDLPVGEF
ncbi:MAG: Gfo/Idh/MocA family oxidoreductase [Clostridiales bacterium]|nr:Gfo/Idh/MocA family oxidoreductase [Clostridiales bacterium]